MTFICSFSCYLLCCCVGPDITGDTIIVVHCYFCFLYFLFSSVWYIVLGTKKHGLSSSADSPEPKKTKKEEPKESSLSAIGSLVAYEGDSSEEEEEEEQVPVKSSKQIEARPTSRTKKQQSLPFWGCAKLVDFHTLLCVCICVSVLN